MNEKRIVMFLAAMANKIDRIIDEHKKIKALLVIVFGIVLAGILSGKPIREAASEGVILACTGLGAIIFAA